MKEPSSSRGAAQIKTAPSMTTRPIKRPETEVLKAPLDVVEPAAPVGLRSATPELVADAVLMAVAVRTVREIEGTTVEEPKIETAAEPDAVPAITENKPDCAYIELGSAADLTRFS